MGFDESVVEARARGTRGKTQATFADLEYGAKKRKTWREKFLERMGVLISWLELEAPIRLRYPNAWRGRRPYPLSLMLRVHCVQLFYNVSGPSNEDMLHEVESVRRFESLRMEALLVERRLAA